MLLSQALDDHVGRVERHNWGHAELGGRHDECPRRLALRLAVQVESTGSIETETLAVQVDCTGSTETEILTVQSRVELSGIKGKLAEQVDRVE